MAYLFYTHYINTTEKCEEIIVNPDIKGAHDKNKEFIGNNCRIFP